MPNPQPGPLKSKKNAVPSHRYALKRAGSTKSVSSALGKRVTSCTHNCSGNTLVTRATKELPDALVGTGRYQRCGDKLSLYLRVDDEGRIREASFQARACAPVVAVASLWSQEITGLIIDEARELSILELDRKLGGLPPSKRHAYLIFL